MSRKIWFKGVCFFARHAISPPPPSLHRLFQIHSAHNNAPHRLLTACQYLLFISTTATRVSLPFLAISLKLFMYYTHLFPLHHSVLASIANLASTTAHHTPSCYIIKPLLGNASTCTTLSTGHLVSPPPVSIRISGSAFCCKLL